MSKKEEGFSGPDCPGATQGSASDPPVFMSVPLASFQPSILLGPAQQASVSCKLANETRRQFSVSWVTKL